MGDIECVNQGLRNDTSMFVVPQTKTLQRTSKEWKVENLPLTSYINEYMNQPKDWLFHRYPLIGKTETITRR